MKTFYELTNNVFYDEKTLATIFIIKSLKKPKNIYKKINPVKFIASFSTYFPKLNSFSPYYF